MLIVSGVGGEKKGPIDLVIDSRRFPGRIHFVLPSRLMPKKLESQAKGFEKGSAAMVKKWLDTHAKALRRLFNEAKYPEAQLKLMLEAMKQVAGQTPLVLKGGRSAALTALALGPRDEIPIFLRIEPPAGTKVGAVFEFDIQQRSSQSHRLLGGSRYRVVVNRPVKR